MPDNITAFNGAAKSIHGDLPQEGMTTIFRYLPTPQTYGVQTNRLDDVNIVCLVCVRGKLRRYDNVCLCHQRKTMKTE